MNSGYAWTKRKRKPFFPLVIILLLATMLYPAAGRAADDAMEQMRVSIDQILAILRRDVPPQPWEEKKREIVAVVRQRFDSLELAQRVLAQHWRDRTDDERRRFAQLFSDVLETTYINKLKTYSDQEIVFKKQLVKGDKAMVYSVIINNKQEIPVDYRLQSNGSQWLLYDIIIEGVSLVQNYRKQFDQIIRKEKYEGLILRMEEKIRENRERDRTVDA